MGVVGTLSCSMHLSTTVLSIMISLCTKVCSTNCICLNPWPVSQIVISSKMAVCISQPVHLKDT